jgi:quinol monooxygenase YgiN
MLYLLFVPFESPYLYYLLETYNKKYTKIPLKTHQKKKHIKDLIDLLKSYKQSYDLPQ